ncbi:MAG: hypothetical protein AAB686_02210, partial [Patescibacteria group bacterium]
QGIVLEFDPSAVKQVAKLGYNPAFGARPLRRVIDDQVRAPLAKQILKKEAARGEKIRLVFQGEEFKFEEVKPQ